jgi:hypothetical protein
MDGQHTDNPDDEVYVQFGPRPTQTIPVSWAEKILRNYMTRYPASFAKAMGDASLEGYQKGQG